MSMVHSNERGVFDQPLARIEPTPLEIIQSAIEKGVDPSTLSALVDLKERLDRQEAAQSYAHAVAEFQARCPTIHKGREVPMSGGGFSYAAFEDIMARVQPVLRDCGLSVSFSTKMLSEKLMEVVCTVRHGIHSEQHTQTIPIPELKVNDAQRMGAAITYAKRYALCGALNIVVTDEDNDAGGLGEKIGEREVGNIEDMLTETQSDRAGFLKWLGVDSVEAIPAGRYSDAMAALRAKAEKQRKGAGR